jgi:N-acetylglucosamine kinase-like BadF-type ATPase
MGTDGARPARPAVLAVDAGNSKADALLVDRAGGIVGAARRLGQSNVGRAGGSAESLTSVVIAVAIDGGLDARSVPFAPVGVYCLAGADFRADERRIDRSLSGQGWTERNVIRNDTYAVLRAGTDRGWGVAVVCGAGMNCIGIGPSGRIVRFPALGPLSGDIAAGGEWTGLAALGAAIRARDGRGERTVLEHAVARHFGSARAETVMHAIHRGRLSSDRLVELPPLVFEAAMAGDGVARRILDRVADEVVAIVNATMRRLRVTGTDVDVILGGGMFRARDPVFFARARDGILAEAPSANVRMLDAPPVLGAALMALDEIAASKRAAERLREAVSHTRLTRTQVGRNRSQRSLRRSAPAGRR